MQSATEQPTTSKSSLWAGRIISGLVIVFMLFDAVIHIARIAPVVQAFQELGWPIRMAVGLGILELVCIAIYLYGRTTVLGAILLTAYLGGAVVTQLRVEHPLFGETLFPAYVGILAWGGLYFRDTRLRRLLPIVAYTSEKSQVSKKRLWTGRIVGAVPALLILFSAIVKLTKAPAVIQGFAQQGFPEHLVVVVGIIETACCLIYLIPRTSVLGAILMAGVMGGATATNVRGGSPAVVLTVVLGVLAWAGLFLRDERVSALIPLRD